MAKVDRLMLWMNLLVNPSSCVSSRQQRIICYSIEARYPIVLVKADFGTNPTKICEENTEILLDYLKILEQEEN
jgi:hypothetical protein